MSQRDRVALVTGGSHGIGKAVVRRLLKDGAKVAFCGRQPDDLKSTASELAPSGAHVLPFVADVSDERQVEKLVGATLERFGRIDILVNNAGIYGPIGPSWENDPERWREAVTVNLFGVFLMCRHVVPVMIKAGRGKIINMSGGGAATPFPRFTAYAVSKAAVVRFTETLAREVVAQGIQVNAIAPGFVVTRLHQQTLAAGERAGIDFLRRTQEEMAGGGVDSGIPADLVAFLASEASDHITGKFISAVWDQWREFPDHLDEIEKTDVYTLRRIVPGDRGMTWK